MRFAYVGGTDPEDYEYLKHIYTKDQAETYDVIYDWRDILNEYIEKQVPISYIYFLYNYYAIFYTLIIVEFEIPHFRNY